MTFGGMTGKSILFPTLQKHTLDWQHSSSHPKECLRNSMPAAHFWYSAGCREESSAGERFAAPVLPALGKVSSGEEQTGCTGWQRRSQSAGLSLGKACDSTGKSVLDWPHGQNLPCHGPRGVTPLWPHGSTHHWWVTESQQIPSLWSPITAYSTQTSLVTVPLLCMPVQTLPTSLKAAFSNPDSKPVFWKMEVVDM